MKIDIEHVKQKLEQHMLLNGNPNDFMQVEWIYLKNSLDEIINLRNKLDIAKGALESIVDPLNMNAYSTAKAALVVLNG